MNYKELFDGVECGYKDEVIEAIESNFDGETVEELAEWLDDGVNDDGAIDELIDSNIDIYYYTLRQWAVDNWEWVEDALEEFGTSGDYHKDIQMGQYLKISEDVNECIRAMVEHIS